MLAHKGIVIRGSAIVRGIFFLFRVSDLVFVRNIPLVFVTVTDLPSFSMFYSELLG